MSEKKMRTTNREAVEEVPWGMYVWVLPDGSTLADDDDNVMNVFCMKGNQKAQKVLAEAAAYYGYPEGRAVWKSGARRITDEELAEQQMRERWGLIPDPLDYGAIMDELRHQKNDGG